MLNRSKRKKTAICELVMVAYDRDLVCRDNTTQDTHPEAAKRLAEPENRQDLASCVLCHLGQPPLYALCL